MQVDERLVNKKNFPRKKTAQKIESRIERKNVSGGKITTLTFAAVAFH